MHAEMSEVAVNNDNNNLAPSLFWSLCEIIGDCLVASIFLFECCAPSEKYLGPKQSPMISHNDPKKDDAKMTCLRGSLPGQIL